ncbi:MAG: N-acetyltransferase [Micavibrio aeruginosavorus]|uniref:N-acetyltransferase n=1 Tax=Micavibrio aeruginosavorus TaxID=349221 RepID=A0A2W5A045_9BACT|nr:MAG: N-acetyltransferase [Micavibrio aeruginosavorus]
MRIRLATEQDVPLLDAVEQSAATAFIGSSVGYVESRSVDPALLMKLCLNKTLWVAVNDANKPVGFAACYPLDGFFYLHEISVAREAQGKGVGRRLMHVLENHALDHNYPYIGLITYRDIRWNGPFYKSLGYREIAPDTYSGLHNKFKDSIRGGVDAAMRCVMIKVLED